MVYSLGDVVVTKKKHPCGCDRWVVVRVGADYKLKCEKCGRVVMMSASEFLKSVRQKVEQDG